MLGYPVLAHPDLKRYSTQWALWVGGWIFQVDLSALGRKKSVRLLFTIVDKGRAKSASWFANLILVGKWESRNNWVVVFHQAFLRLGPESPYFFIREGRTKDKEVASTRPAVFWLFPGNGYEIKGLEIFGFPFRWLRVQIIGSTRPKAFGRYPFSSRSKAF